MSEVKHGAQFTPHLIPEMADMLRPHIEDDAIVLDPFAGVGGIHQLREYLPVYTVGIEIQPKWAECHIANRVGDATNLDVRSCTINAVVTSPTYGNRCADDGKFQLSAKDRAKYKRNAYTSWHGAPLEANNTGRMQWGEKYRVLHALAWAEAYRVLFDGGLFLLNIKDHYRTVSKSRAESDPYMAEVKAMKSGVKCLVRVTDWHVDALLSLGFTQIDRRDIECTGIGYGANRERTGYESLILFRK